MIPLKREADPGIPLLKTLPRCLLTQESKQNSLKGTSRPSVICSSTASPKPQQPHLASDLTSFSLLLFHSPPATVASMLFLESCRHILTWKSSYQLFPLPGMLFPNIYKANLTPFSHLCSYVAFSRKTIPTTTFEVTACPQHSQFPVLALLFPFVSMTLTTFQHAM